MVSDSAQMQFVRLKLIRRNQFGKSNGLNFTSEPTASPSLRQMQTASPSGLITFTDHSEPESPRERQRTDQTALHAMEIHPVSQTHLSK